MMFIRRWECSFREANHGYLFVSGTTEPLLRLGPVVPDAVSSHGRKWEPVLEERFEHVGRAQVR